MTRNRNEGWIAAILLTTFFLITAVYIASQRLFWFDEITSVLIARLPGVSHIWKALLGGTDLQPLPFYLVERASESIFGRGGFGARLPSTVGLAVGLLVVFDCTRRFTSGRYGVLAQAILTCSFLPYYGSEARPYGLLFLFSTLLLWTWVRDSENSKRSAIAFGAAAFAASMVHFYAIFCLIPYAAYDLAIRRRMSGKLAAGAIGVALGLGPFVPQLIAGRRVVVRPSWWLRPTFNGLREIFETMFPHWLFLLVLIIVVAAVFRTQKSAAPLAMPGEERLGWFFLLIPMAGFVAAAAVTKSFYDRYFISALPGIAAAFASLLYRQFGEDRRMTRLLLVLFVGTAVARQVSHVRHPELINGNELSAARQLIAMEDTFAREGKPYTAVSDEHIWAEAWFYSKHPERYVALADPNTIAGVMTRNLPGMQRWSTADLQQQGRHTAVVLTFPEMLKLQESGLRETIRMSAPVLVVYVE